MDMYQVMKALRQVRFNGAVEPDHVHSWPETLACGALVLRIASLICEHCYVGPMRR